MAEKGVAGLLVCASPEQPWGPSQAPSARPWKARPCLCIFLSPPALTAVITTAPAERVFLRTVYILPIFACI